MGIRNREKRAAKQRTRQRASNGRAFHEGRAADGRAFDGQAFGGQAFDGQAFGGSAFDGQAFGGSAFDGQAGAGRPGDGRAGGGAPRLPGVEELAVEVLAVAEDCARGDTAAAPRLADLLVNGLGQAPKLVSRAIELAALDGLTHCWRIGWQPADLWHLTRRRVPAAVSYLVDLLAADAAKYSDAALAPAWSAQLRRLEAEVWWRAEQPHLDQWVARHRKARTETVVLVIEWLAQLRLLPRMSELIPPPGSAAARTAGTAGTRSGTPSGTSGTSGTPSGTAGSRAPDGVDPKILTRIRALLAKAESTEFEEEADAFFGKAQELMSRYALERAMLDGDGGVGPGGRRIWLDAPYVSAKSMLINQVAMANRSKAVFHSGLDCMTVLGDEVDLELVEMLSTALLVHASSAMVLAGRQQDRYGQSRTKSFRQSFLVSYATRIGERLTAADARTAEAMADELGDGRLLPVLAARTQEVEKLYETLFPALSTRRVSVSNSAGWGAGRVAADQANLDVRRAVRR